MGNNLFCFQVIFRYFLFCHHCEHTDFDITGMALGCVHT